MKRRTRAVLLLCTLAIILSGCDGFEPAGRRDGRFDRVFILYSLGFNNLSGDLDRNIDTLCAGNIPGEGSRDAVVVFSHSLDKDYNTPTRPVVFRIFRKDGKAVRDTVGFFHPTLTSASTEMLTRTLEFIRGRYPAERYSMLLSSHGTGWLKPNYSYKGGGISTLSTSRRNEGQEWPETKSIGASFTYEGSKLVSTEMDIAGFASAIPMHLDFLIFDACLMGGVETAYELKEVCDRIVFSPTEVLTRGFAYRPMCNRIFGSEEADLNGIAEDYFNYYMKQSGSSQAASVSVIECAGLDRLASEMKSIISAHRTAFSSGGRTGIQRYFYAGPYDSRYKPWYYDIRDAAAACGASGDELSRLDAALEACVSYHAETPKFFDLMMDRCCGLSMYLPEIGWTELNSYYRTLAWNSATGLVE